MKRRSTLGIALCLAIGLYCLVSLLGPTQLQADIYACRSKDGSVQYTNRKQRGKRCTAVVKSSKRKASTQKRAPRKSKNTASKARPPVSTTSPSLPSKMQASTQGAAKGKDAVKGELRIIIEAAAARYVLPADLLEAVMWTESRGNTRALSPKGAMGLMQLMPQTARAMGVIDAWDPEQNIHGGARYLRMMANRFNGSLVHTLAAYNAGPEAVSRHNGIPPYAETQRYVPNVLRRYYQLRAQ